MASTGEETIEIAALGRPFQLGMLYDCRKDVLVPGITLWNREQLQKNTTVRSQNNTEFQVTKSDSINDKSKNLKVDGSLKVSLLGGLVPVNGAARYFNDNKKSFKQERLTLHYRTSANFEQLTMNHLADENMAHHEVFDHDTATHVVTALLYGADAHFVFDREDSSDEEKPNPKRELKIAFDKIKKIVDVGAEVSLNMNENEKEAMEKFNCTFYGDFKLPSNPTTFEHAVKVYSDLPKRLGEKGEHAIPLKVWLYPLVKLNSRAAKLQRNISTEIIMSLESVIEALNITEMKCADLLADTVARSFREFQDHVEAFQKSCCQYKTCFITKLGSILPAIRGGQTEINDLTHLLMAHEESPFNDRELKQWIKAKENESAKVKAVLKQLQDLGAEVNDDIDEYLLDLKVENVVCYAFTFWQQQDVLLIKQQNYLKPSEMQESSVNTLGRDGQESPLSSKHVREMKNNMEYFRKLMTSNKSQSTKFIILTKPQTPNNDLGSCILMYENGSDEAVCFEPPAKPLSPLIEEVQDDSITVKLNSSCPATEERNLLYKKRKEKDWKSQLVHMTEDRVTLTDLEYGTDYDIKCKERKKVGNLDYVVESDEIHFTTTNHKKEMDHRTGVCQTDSVATGSQTNANNLKGESAQADPQRNLQAKTEDIQDEVPLNAKAECEREINDLKEAQKEIFDMIKDVPELSFATGLSLILLGNTGPELTAVKNTILGREETNWADTFAEDAQGEVAGQKVTVLETDFLHPEHWDDLPASGPRAYLLVIPVQLSVENAEEVDEKIRMMEESFGANCWRNTMILFTVTSDELQKKYTEAITQSPRVKRLGKKWGNRFFCLNVRERGNDSQVLMLLKMIEKMVEEKVDSSKIFKMLTDMEKKREEVRREMEESLKKLDQDIEGYKIDISILKNDKEETKMQFVDKLKSQYEIKQDIGRHLRRMYDRAAGMEEDRRFLKVLIPETNQTLWLSVPNEQTNKDNELAGISDLFLIYTNTQE